MEYKNSADGLQFVVLATAKLLPDIHHKMQIHLNNGKLTQEMLKNFHVLHTSHSMLISHSKAIGYLISKHKTDSKAEDELRKELKSSKAQAETVYSALLLFQREITNGENILSLIKKGISQIKTPKKTVNKKTVKIGRGEQERNYIVGGATEFKFRDKKLARKYGNDNIFKDNEKISDLLNMPLDQYFMRLIKEYNLDDPVKTQVKMCKKEVGRIKEIMSEMKSLYKKIDKKYEKVFLPLECKIPEKPKIDSDKVSHNDLLNAYNYITSMRHCITRMLAYLSVDKNNRDGSIVVLEEMDFPQMPQINMKDIEIPQILNLQPKKSSCGCPKDDLINRDKALKPYLYQVEMSYGDLAQQIGELISLLMQYDLNKDYGQMKKYAKACASRLEPGQDIEDILIHSLL